MFQGEGSKHLLNSCQSFCGALPLCRADCPNVLAGKYPQENAIEMVAFVKIVSASAAAVGAKICRRGHESQDFIWNRSIL